MTVRAEPFTVVSPAVSPPFEIERVLAHAAEENFPVALGLLSKLDRAHLLAIYGFARFVDDVGDRYVGDRTAALAWVDTELDAALSGAPAHPVFERAAALARGIGMDDQPFRDLIAANRLDQTQSRYASYAELEAYCALSANPVGRLVLRAFGRDDARAVGLSDAICTALQIIEHLQDIGEDFANDRIYLPADDRLRFEVREDDLAAPVASAALRRLVAFECGRARALLSEGSALLSLFSGRRRLALAGFVGGGIAQLDEIERRGYDTLCGLAQARKVAVAAAALRVYGRGAEAA